MPNTYPNAPPANNNLGVAGFIVSLVGIIACGGIISPVGMIMSYIAMRRQSDGLSIAGFVLGVIGSIGFIIALVFGLFGLILAALGLAAAAAGAGSP